MFLNFRWHKLHSTGFGSAGDLLATGATAPGDAELTGDGLPPILLPFALPGELACVSC